METDSIEIDFDKMAGLTPAIVQDSAKGEILMLGFMNRGAWERTLSTGYVTFYSRTRNRLWTKGETSGNRLRLLSAATDCDRDTLLLQVESSATKARGRASPEPFQFLHPNRKHLPQRW
jgi:phosphoribosyl-ATP pyrophosphohydrolase/phosphoribosyl-AMP cyclohydrolase